MRAGADGWRRAGGCGGWRRTRGWVRMGKLGRYGDEEAEGEIRTRKGERWLLLGRKQGAWGKWEGREVAGRR